MKFATPLKRLLSKRKPKKKRPISKNAVTDRRLGLWRKIPDGATGEKKAVYVSIDGEVISSVCAAKKAQKADKTRTLIIPKLGNDPCTLGYWGLPKPLIENYALNARVTTLFPWQAACLEKLTLSPEWASIYTAPTSGGKTLVAELLILRNLLYQGERAIFVVPFVSICREKAAQLRRVWDACALRVEEFHGGATEMWSTGIDLALCTAEKANSILNRWISSPDSPKSGTIVIDEFHSIVTDESRGYLVESLLVKLKLLHASGRFNFRLIGLSATLPALDALAAWLGAEIYRGAYRPVQLNFWLRQGDSLIPISQDPAKIVKTQSPEDPDGLAAIIAESPGSVLVFCHSKIWAEKSASLLSRLLPPAPEHAREQLLAALRLTPGGPTAFTRSCEASILAGVAHHHAGLTVEQRSLLEAAFRAKHIRVLCATTTLSAGVNLPARRVIIRSVSVLGPQPGLARERLLQMAGRAGRTGYDSAGDAIIFVQNDKEAQWVRGLLSDDGGGVEVSGTLHKGSRLGKLLLECVGTGLINTRDDIDTKFRPALLSQGVLPPVDYLTENRLLVVSPDSTLSLTPLGEAVAFCAMQAEEAAQVYRDLQAASRCLKLDNNDFQLVLLATPPTAPSLLSELSLSNAEVSEIFASLCPAALRIPGAATSKRLLCAVALHALLTRDLSEVSRTLRIPGGALQSMQASSASFCGMLVSFCERLRWWSLSAALATLVPRLQFASPAFLLPLTRLPEVFPARARALHAAGLDTLQKLAEAEPLHVAAIIGKVEALEDGGVTAYLRELRRAAMRIVRAAAQALAQESENLLQNL